MSPLRTMRGFLGGFPAANVAFGMGALLGLGVLAVSVVNGGLHEFDHWILGWMERRRSPMMNAIALEITVLGDGTAVLAMAVVAGLFLWLTGQRLLAALFILAPPGALLFNLGLKHLFDRPRPPMLEVLAEHSGPSFPSGHAAAAMVVYVLVVYAVLSLKPGRALRFTVVCAAAVLVPLVGLSRVYLGVHYPSDVLAGFAVGIFWALLAITVAKRRSTPSSGQPALTL